jgi:hypothetical protein
MNSEDTIGPAELETLSKVFAEQLLACLQACARGRRGLFSDLEMTEGTDENHAWPEAARLRELAVALEAISHQAGEANALCGEFLELCTIHGEAHPGEPRLAREFLARIERGEVGGAMEERKPW